MLESIYRRTRALLLVHKIELVLMTADFGASNRLAYKELSTGAPKELPLIPVWETPSWPLTVEQMEDPSWNYYPICFSPDVVEHWLKHIIYSFYEYEANLGPGPRDSFRFSELLFGLLGAKPIGNRYLCSRPGDIDLCTLRKKPLVSYFGGDVPAAKAWHRKLRLGYGLGTAHLEISDVQKTEPAIEVAQLWPLLAEIGESTVARFLQASTSLYMSARGRDVDGQPTTREACLEADHKALLVLEEFWTYMMRPGNGRDANLKRPRGGWTNETMDAIRLAVHDWSRFVKMNLVTGFDRIRADKISARFNELLHSELKQGGNKFLDVNQTLQMGERHQGAALLRTDTLAPLLTKRRGDKLYSTFKEAVEEASSMTASDPSRFDDWDPLHNLRRRARLARLVDVDGSTATCR
jgi:hypothetical protein